jgi:hypothetical protein
LGIRRLSIYLLIVLLFLAAAWLGGPQASWATPLHSSAQQTVPTPTPEPGVSQAITLSVNLQRPNSPPPHPSWSVPVTFTLHSPGSTGVAAYQWNLSLDTSGHWSGSLTLPSGSYDVRVKNMHTLRNVKRNVVIDGSANINMGTLLEGDADGDNRVRAADFTLLRAAYFTQEGDPGFDPRTDFDEDNRIRSSDFALLRSNYFATGDIEVGTARAAAALPEGVVALALEPPSLTVLSGEVFTITLMAHAGDQPFVGLDADIRFPPDALQVVGTDGQPATQIEPSGTLTVLSNSANNVTGRILYGAGVASDVPPLTGDVTVARLHFRALRTAPRLSVAMVDGTVSDPTGLFVTGQLSGAQVTVAPANDFRFIYIPVILRSK